MSEKILVPVLGESISEATVSKWLKNKGDIVNADEAIVELETDKVNLEVPATTSGILSEINSNEGDTVKVGSVLAVISDPKVTTDKVQEIELKKDLESNVSVVDFKQGKINIEFNSKLSKNFPKLLTNKLFEWTGKKWVISFTNDKSDRLVNKEKNFEDIKSSEVYKSVMESFPDAEFINKQNANEDD